MAAFTAGEETTWTSAAAQAVGRGASWISGSRLIGASAVVTMRRNEASELACPRCFSQWLKCFSAPGFWSASQPPSSAGFPLLPGAIKTNWRTDASEPACPRGFSFCMLALHACLTAVLRSPRVFFHASERPGLASFPLLLSHRVSALLLSLCV